MEAIKERFEKILDKIETSGKSATEWFGKYTHELLMNPDNWWEALAVCKYALDRKESQKETADFFRLIFEAYDCNVEVDLNEEEYAFWWEKVQETCDRVGEFDGAGWTQKGSQYAEARYGLRDTGKLLPYYEKAAGMGDEHAQATVAFWKYMGYYCQPDREEGKRIFAKLTTPEGLRWKKFYQACIENYAGNEGQARQLRQELLEVLSEKDRMRAHIYAVIGDELDNDETKTAVIKV